MKHERTIEESIAPMCCVRMGEGVAKVNGESIAPMCCVRMGEGVAKVNGRCFVRTEQTKKQYKDGRSNVNCWRQANAKLWSALKWSWR